MKNSATQILQFLTKLKANNNREWFHQHKDEYEAVKPHFNSVATDFINAVAQYEPSAANYTPAQCTYRLYRDTRFSADKTPYKTHFGVFVNPPLGKKGETLGYYLHLEPGNSFFAAGTGWCSAPVLKAIRQGIYDEIDDFRAIVESADFKTLFTEIGMEPLKTAPKGFPKDWPFIDYLKPRIYGASSPIDETIFKSDNWIANLDGRLAVGAQFNRFCNYFVGEALGLDLDL